ncbi:hypothetical protein CEXT_173691 [Caerostris extrusa]|uniref:Uncharacterized protein n=1 Tax=Caerostris extrusa TaxID=172846 RepID=A0AAV4V2C7_CAEEX|nr:hypothetical protein CEXT_173691 [Caerostris extrusa]
MSTPNKAIKSACVDTQLFELPLPIKWARGSSPLIGERSDDLILISSQPSDYAHIKLDGRPFHPIKELNNSTFCDQTAWCSPAVTEIDSGDRVVISRSNIPADDR